MIPLPTILNSFQQDALETIKKGLVKEIEFANSTYQVLVEDLFNRKDYWVFLQLEGKRQIKDAICSCEAANEFESISPCRHTAAAYLAIFGKYSVPLHQRFSRSLWNHLAYLYSKELGENPNVLKKIDNGHYTQDAINPHFYIKATTKESLTSLTNLLTKNRAETEETSIKFSNLSDEELLKWEAGKPSNSLRYELSYWSDLAKWLLQKQEESHPYSITFKYTPRKFPDWIDIKFDDLELGFYLSEENLPSIIPSLTTVKSPLSVFYDNNEGISCITYDPEVGQMHIEPETLKQPLHSREEFSNSQSIHLEGWVYVPEKGFFSDEPHTLLQTPTLSDEELSNALTEYGKFISQFLVDYKIHFNANPLKYKLSFDAGWNLNIEAYLHKPGDLTEGFSKLLGDWAYLDSDGFYHIEGNKFHDVVTIIEVHQISDFVSRNRNWLNLQNGFKTHVRSVEYQLSYTLSSNDRLTFSRVLAETKKNTKQQDFGSWIFLEGYGFFPKSVSSFGFLVRPGLSLSAQQIPLFIRMNHDELALIPNFFSLENPIKKAGLKVEVIDNHAIKISPVYDLYDPTTSNKIRWFDEYVYVDGKGFYEIPLELKLPEKYRHTVELEGEELSYFIKSELDTLRKQIVFLDPRLEHVEINNLVTRQVIREQEKGRGWYQFEFYYNTDKGPIPATEIGKALKKKENYLFLSNGVLPLENERFDWLFSLKKNRFDFSKKLLSLSSLEFMKLNAFDPISIDSKVEIADSSQELLEELIELKTPEDPNIGGLVSHLRPYQEIGVRWLWFLYHQHMSGLLCDDMGLGKTHQAMALLVSIYNYFNQFAEGFKKHFLIVCPTSVIYHWQEKMQEFLPSLKIYTFYGSDRSVEGFRSQYDVLLTSYGILRNEQEILSKIPFEVAIFDEIQIAKNQSSRVYAALRKMNVQMKVGLTGTPIENYLRELKSLFDIVLPSYMPNETEYRELFIKPIEKEGNEHRKDLLNRLIKPFILRRKKEEVLTDLPEKIEEIAHCDLSPYQRQLYSEVLLERRRHLLNELENTTNAIPYLHIFALLSSLKQICDHPAVYLKKPEDFKNYESGKWDLFCELLREARESQQKVVVFTQYLGMMDIIEYYLTEQEIGFASIRGATQNRKEQIKNFNENPNCEVFIASLQAAGLGVDLTGGSMVIHYDRWWNAARENQATDRVHRIGQTRGVQVFKLITKNTFEEKIDAMILRKGQLMEEVIGVDDQQTIKKFTREELIDLLSFNDTGDEHLSISDSD